MCTRTVRTQCTVIYFHFAPLTPLSYFCFLILRSYFFWSIFYTLNSSYLCAPYFFQTFQLFFDDASGIVDLDGDESRLLYTEYVQYEYTFSEYTVQVQPGGIASRFNIILPKGLIAAGTIFLLNTFLFIWLFMLFLFLFLFCCFTFLILFLFCYLCIPFLIVL